MGRFARSRAAGLSVLWGVLTPPEPVSSAHTGRRGAWGGPPGQGRLAQRARSRADAPRGASCGCPRSPVPFGLRGGRRRLSPRSGKARAAARAWAPPQLLRLPAGGPALACLASARSPPSRIQLSFPFPHPCIDPPLFPAVAAGAPTAERRLQIRRDAPTLWGRRRRRGGPGTLRHGRDDPFQGRGRSPEGEDLR